MKSIAAEIAAIKELEGLFAGLEGKSKSRLVYGIDDSARHLTMAAVHIATDRPLLIVAADLVKAGKIYEDLLAVFGDGHVFLFPEKNCCTIVAYIPKAVIQAPSGWR